MHLDSLDVPPPPPPPPPPAASALLSSIFHITYYGGTRTRLSTSSSESAAAFFRLSSSSWFLRLHDIMYLWLHVQLFSLLEFACSYAPEKKDISGLLYL